MAKETWSLIRRPSRHGGVGKYWCVDDLTGTEVSRHGFKEVAVTQAKVTAHLRGLTVDINDGPSE